MPSRVDVLCGQMNLHKGLTGAANLMLHLESAMHKGSNVLGMNQGRRNDRITAEIQSFLMFLQEPPTKDKRVVGLSGSHPCHYDKSVDRPRTAIYASKDLQIWPVPAYMSRDVTTCIWLTGEREIYVVSAYFDIQLEQVIPPKLQELMRYCESRNKEVIVAADTNSHSTLWGCITQNTRGDIVDDWVYRYGLKIQNNGNHFTFFRGEARTIVDVTFTRGAAIGAAVTDWEVTEDVQGSDHLLLQWRIPISSPKRNQVRNWVKGDWLQFQVCLEEVSIHRQATHRGEWNREQLDDAVEEFVQDIKDCLKDSHPLHTRRVKVPGLAYFGPTLLRWKKKVHASFSYYRMHPSEETFEQFRQARREYKHRIKKAKKDAWKEFCAEATEPAKAARITKIITGRVNQTLGLMKETNGTLLEDPGQSLSAVINTHFPGNLNSPRPETTDNRTINVYDPKASFITDQAVTDAIHTFGPRKAAGPDGFPPCVLQHFGETAVRRLRTLYQASYLLEYVPKLWRKSKVIFIPKIGKADYSQPRSFRPITLSPFLMKVMERVILWYITEVHFQDNQLSDYQHAFRGGRSTETALTELVSNLEKGLAQKNYSLGVFLDIQGAFDNVRPEAIRTGMENKDLPISLINWYCHYIGNRSMVVNHNGITDIRYLVQGTPQGGVLSPVIWNLVFDSLLASLEESQVIPTGFADDAGLTISGSKPCLMMSCMQHAVDRALEWGRRCGLRFSPEKTVVVLFTRKYKPEIPQQLEMYGKSVPFSDTVKYLGVTLDAKLTWKSHVETKVKAAKTKLNRLRTSMGKLWGINPLMTRWIFIGIIRPALSYGSLVWARCMERLWAANALRKVNRISLMMLGHFRRSTPTAGLEVIMQVRPLPIHIKYEACLALNRTQFTRGRDGTFLPRQLVLGGHREYCTRIMTELGLDMVETDKMIPTYRWKNTFKVDKESFLKGKPHNQSLGTFEIYTDGSGIEGKFGSGVAIFKGPAQISDPISTQRFYLGEESSVFQGEVYAIWAAARWIKENRLGRTIVIYSDSRSALNALAKTKTNSQLVQRTQRELCRAGEVNTVILRWVKAHAGHKGNELADELAKEGTEQAQICENAPKIPESMVKMRFRLKFDTLWQQEWTVRTDCRQTKQWFPLLDKSRAFMILHQGRKAISWMVQLITGHNFMKRHESLVQDNADNECRLCLEDEETTLHIMAECPALAAVRLQVFGIPFQSIPLRWSIREIVSFVRGASIDSLLDPANIYGIAE